MFATITTYTCNGCMKTATEDKTNNWMHLNNSPDNGQRSMDFCPDCTVALQSVLVNTVNKPTEPVVDSVNEDTIESEAVVTTKQEPIVEKADMPVDTNVTPVELEERDERFVDFYKRLYTRVIYDIACDHEITSCVPYLPYIPGKLAVDKRSTIDDTQAMIIINSKRIRIVKDSDKIGATVITIYNGASIAVTRKVSTFEGVKTLIQDISTTEVNLLPTINTQYTVAHLNNVLTKLNKVDDITIPVDELKNWIVYTAELSGIPLN